MTEERTIESVEAIIDLYKHLLKTTNNTKPEVLAILTLACAVGDIGQQLRELVKLVVKEAD